jgi:DNA replication protein DnaT
MTRIRTIKPEFWTDEKMSPMDDTVRLVFLALISMADDGGRLVNSPKAIEAFVWPFHDDRSRDLRDALATLSRMGRIRAGMTEAGQPVVEIIRWDRHQKIDKPRKCNSRSRLRHFARLSRRIRERFATSSRKSRD